MSIVATTTSLAVCSGLLKMGQNPKVFPSMGCANVTSDSAMSPMATITAFGMGAIIAPSQFYAN
jgi:hypothetical protein